MSARTLVSFAVIASCGPSTAAMHVRVYASSEQVASCDDLGQVSGHASGWGDRFRVDAENDARENALKLGADAVRVTSHEAGFAGHTVAAEAYRCDRATRDHRLAADAKPPLPSLPKPTRLMVLDFRVLGADPRLGQILTRMVSAELQRVGNLTVIDRADIEAGLGAIGSRYAVSGNLFDSRASLARVRFSRTVDRSEDNLVALIPELSAELARGMLSE